MTNTDELILLSHQVDPSSQTPVLHQVLRIAMYDELHALTTYAKIIEKFGPNQPFVNIFQAEQNHINALAMLFEKYGVAMPTNDWESKIELPATLQECCELGIAAELDNIKMYDNLIQHIQEADVLDIFYRLQAASYNNHLPAFRECVANFYAQQQAQSYAKHSHENILGAFLEESKHHDLYNAVNSLLKGKFDLQSLGKILDNENKDVILGALLGAGVTFALNNTELLKTILKKEEEE